MFFSIAWICKTTLSQGLVGNVDYKYSDKTKILIVAFVNYLS